MLMLLKIARAVLILAIGILDVLIDSFMLHTDSSPTQFLNMLGTWK